MEEETLKNIQAIAHKIQANTHIYNALPSEDYEEHVVRILKRLKMQKELFVKEIANAFNLKTSNLILQDDSILKSYYQKVTDKYKDSISKKDMVGCIALLIEIEQELYETYISFLFEEKLGEIAKMILRNQSNEIKRDVRILNNLYEYA